MKTLFALIASVRLALGLPSQDQQIDVVAAVLWAEARSEGAAGIDAVAEVIRNRTRKAPRFGSTPYEAVTQKKQFSCLNCLPASKLVSRAKSSCGTDRTMWLYSRLAAEELVAGTFYETSVGSALYFCLSDEWMPKGWQDHDLRYVTTIGRHHFYR